MCLACLGLAYLGNRNKVVRAVRVGNKARNGCKGPVQCSIKPVGYGKNLDKI